MKRFWLFGALACAATAGIHLHQWWSGIAADWSVWLWAISGPAFAAMELFRERVMAE